MIIQKEDMIKQQLVEVMSSEYAYTLPGVGLFFDDISIVYDQRYAHIVDSEDYPIIEQKVKGIFELVNQDPTLADKDIETELWYMV